MVISKEKEKLKMEKGSIQFIFTEEQQEIICGHFNKDKDKLEDWEICELLDKVIDNLVL